MLNGGEGDDSLDGDGGEYLAADSSGAISISLDAGSGNITVVQGGNTYGGDTMIFTVHDPGPPMVPTQPETPGNDVLDGGPGDDTLTGGGGVDRFVFAPGQGHDTLTDYEAGETLDFKAFSGASVLSSVQYGSTVLSVAGVPIVTLRNYTAALTIVN